VILKYERSTLQSAQYNVLLSPVDTCASVIEAWTKQLGQNRDAKCAYTYTRILNVAS